MQALLLGCFLCVCALLVANAAIRPRRPPIVERLVVSVGARPACFSPPRLRAFMCIYVHLKVCIFRALMHHYVHNCGCVVLVEVVN